MERTEISASDRQPGPQIENTCGRNCENNKCGSHSKTERGLKCVKACSHIDLQSNSLDFGIVFVWGTVDGFFYPLSRWQDTSII